MLLAGHRDDWQGWRMRHAYSSSGEMELRRHAMAWLDRRPGRLVNYSFLASYVYDGVRVSLIDRQRGIRKPRLLSAALAIRTTYTPPGRKPPYVDEVGADGLQRYMYRGTDPEHPENTALRRAKELSLPLIWFVGVASGEYEPIYPVYVIGEEREQHRFVLALDEAQRFIDPATGIDQPMRRYLERLTKERLHQRLFRARVLLAYRERCTICELGHSELLDAAHIVRDADEGGDPVVSNGLAMCKIHHAAYDQRFLGIRPDLTVHVRTDLLEELDGPMLRHGLQAVHNTKLAVLPRARTARPDPARLELRYAEFLAAM